MTIFHSILSSCSGTLKILVMNGSETEAVVATPSLTRDASWRAGVLALCIVGLYASVLAGLTFQWWTQPDYSHGFLVPLFSGYMLWRRREKLRAVPQRPSWTGLIVLCGSLCVLFVGSLGAELYLQRVSLLGVIVGLLAWLHGWRLVRAAAFPLAFLLLMIPLPGLIYYQLVMPLQSLAAQLATRVLQFIHLFPVQREGNVLVLPSTTLEVAEACSGIRSVLSLLTVTAIYAYMMEQKNVVRWILLLLVFPISVAANAGRIVFAAISAELAGASAVEGWAHTLSGLFLFFFAILLVVACHALISSVIGRPGQRGEIV